MSITDELNKTYYNASGSAVVRGQIVRATTGVNQATTALATAGAANLAGVVSSLRASAGAAFQSAVDGAVLVLLETGLTPVGGQKVYVSATVAGRGTTVAPSVAEFVGFVVDASLYTTQGLVQVVLQLSDGRGTDVANWVGNGYFAVDNENGNDANSGFSSVSMAAAGLVAVKTPEQLAKLIPITGNISQGIVIAFKGRTGIYVGPDGVTIANFAKTLLGYGNVTIRSTTDFSDTTTDQRRCGSENAITGPNADGSFTVDAGASATALPVVGGGLATDKSLFAYRIRFIERDQSLSTTYSALENNTATVITPPVNFTVVPTVGELFVIEKPSVELGTLSISVAGISPLIAVGAVGGTGLSVVGIETQALFNATGASFYTAFCNIVDPCALQIEGFRDLQISVLYTTGLGLAPVSVGAGLRVLTTGLISIINIGFFSRFFATSIQSPSTALFSISADRVLSVGAVYLGRPSVSSVEINIGSGMTPSNSFSRPRNVWGNRGSATVRPWRIGGTGAFFRIYGSLGFYGLVMEDSAILTYNGSGLGVTFDDITGTSLASYAINVEDSLGSTYVCGRLAANTLTGAGGAAFAAAGVNPIFWADLISTNILDVNGNNLIGTGLSVTGQALVMSGLAAAVQGDVLRGTGVGNGTAFAQADTEANAYVVGVMLSGSTTVVFASAGPYVVATFDGAPSPGQIAYLSADVAGRLTTVSPTAGGTRRKLRVGRVIRVVSGTKAVVAWFPENISVAADGAA